MSSILDSLVAEEIQDKVNVAFQAQTWDDITSTIQNLTVQTSNNSTTREKLIIALIDSSDELTVAWGTSNPSIDHEEAKKLYKAAYFLKTAYTLSPKKNVENNAIIVNRLRALTPLFEQISTMQKIQTRDANVDPDSYLTPIDNFSRRQARALNKG